MQRENNRQRWTMAILLCGMVWACGGSGGDGTSPSTDTGSTPDTGPAYCPYSNHHSAQPCNPLCPDSNRCEDGGSCVVLSTGLLGCVGTDDLDYTQALGKGCNDETLCKEGLCVELDEDGRKCRPFCVGDVDCSDGGTCGVEVSVGSLTFGACIPPPPSCSVFEQDCADPGDGCVLAQGGTVCMDAGTNAYNTACDAPNDCVKGLICVSDKCHTPCNPKTGGADPKCHLLCPGTQAEVTDDVGVCALPDDEDPCDLLSQDCPLGEACTLTGQGPRCRNAGTTAVGMDCTEEDECVKGAICWPQGTSCKAICNPDEGIHPECEDRFAAQCPIIFQNMKGGYCDE